MEFRFKSCSGVCASVLLWGCIASQAEGGNPVITVLVNDGANVDHLVLGEAEKEAGRIFHAAGIEISWVNCIGGKQVARCRVEPGLNEFVLHIVKSGKTSSDSVFGEAFLAADGTGKYCDVFFERIKREAELSVTPALLLGSVMAHELGHLLLSSKAHSLWGIMQPIWHQDELSRVEMGALLFNPAESRLMRGRIEAVNLAATKSSVETAIGPLSELRRSTAAARLPRLRGFLP
jgi:hypothetical protein